MEQRRAYEAQRACARHRVEANVLPWPNSSIIESRSTAIVALRGTTPEARPILEADPAQDRPTMSRSSTTFVTARGLAVGRFARIHGPVMTGPRS
jgi:hypothetical protein